jgi:hypothetical protein
MTIPARPRPAAGAAVPAPAVDGVGLPTTIRTSLGIEGR